MVSTQKPLEEPDDINPLSNPLPDQPPDKVKTDPSTFTYKSFIDQAFVQPFSSLMVGYFRGSASITQTLDSYAKALEQKFPNVPGMDRGGLFKDLTKLYQERSAYWEQKGIPEGEGFASDLAQALYEGGGQFGVELPAIMSLGQWGLPIYAAITGDGVAAEEGKSVLKGLSVGGVEGTALHFTLKGVRVLPRVYGAASGGSVFGGLTLQEELQKPEGDVDWANVVAQTLLGIGLTVGGRRVPQQDFINNLRRTFAKDKTSFLKFVKSQKISDKNANKLYDKLQENETEISPELKETFKDQLEPEPELKVPKTPESDAAAQVRSVPTYIHESFVGKDVSKMTIKEVFDFQKKQQMTKFLDPDTETNLRLFHTQEITKAKAEPLDTTPVTKETIEKLRSAVDKVDESESDLPKYARSINLERLDIPDAQKRLMVELGNLEPKLIQTWDQTGELSKEILLDYNRVNAMMKKRGKGEILTVPETDALRTINANAVHRLKEIVEAGAPEDVIAETQRYYHDIYKATADNASDFGRGMNIHKKLISEGRMAKAFMELERNMNERELNEFKNMNLENPEEVLRFIGRLGDPKAQDYFFEYWYNSILSGIPTHMVNITSNTAWSLFQIPHRALAGGLDKMIVKLTGKPRQRYLNETLPLMAGYRRGFGKGGKRAWETIKTGEPPMSLETKWTIEMGSAQGAFERSPYKIARTLSPFLTAPSRALRAMDVWANSIAYDGQINALARRTGQNKGLTGEILKNYEKAFVKNPPERMHKEAMEFAKYTTFMSDPGKISKWISEGRHIATVKGISVGKLIVPFVNTIANLTKRGMEMTPILGLGMYQKGMPAAELLAKQIEGSVLALYAYYKTQQGEITGDAPEEKTKREAFYRQGKKPWAIKMGDQWVQYRRIEPFNTVIGSAAVAWNALEKDDEATATEKFGDVADGIVKNLIDSSYLQGVANVLDRFGKRKGAIERTVAGFVPYSSFWRSLNRSAEVMMEGEAKFRNAQTLFDAFSQVIPGLSGNAPAKMDVWGKEIVIEGGVLRQWLPYKWSKQTTDELELELERLGVYPGLPGKFVTINKIKKEIPDDIYKDYAISLGNTLKLTLDQVIMSDGYKNISKNTINPEFAIILKKSMLQRAMGSLRNVARDVVKSKL